MAASLSDDGWNVELIGTGELKDNDNLCAERSKRFIYRKANINPLSVKIKFSLSPFWVIHIFFQYA